MSVYQGWPEDVDSETEEHYQGKAAAEQESACVLHEAVERQVELFYLESGIERVHRRIHWEFKQAANEEGNHEDLLPDLCSIVAPLAIFDVDSLEDHKPHVYQMRVVGDCYEAMEQDAD